MIAEASLVRALAWAKTAEDGDYLVRYEETGMSEAEDPTGRCGYGDMELDEIDRRLGARGLKLIANDRGLVAESLAPKRGRGRPPRADGAATAGYLLHLTAAERARWQTAADDRGVSLAELVRTAVERDIER